MMIRKGILLLVILSFFNVSGCVRSVETSAKSPKEPSVKAEETKSEEDLKSQEEAPLWEEVSVENLKEVKENIPKENTPKEKTVVISLAGDCSLGKLSIHGYQNTFYEKFDQYGAGYFFENVKSVFESDDMTLVNFEGVLTESNELVEKQYNIKGRPEFNQVLVEGDIEAVSFGNNHRIDYGQQGVDDTIAAFKEVNVVYAYDNNLGIYETDSGVVIGYVSVNVVYDGQAVEVFLQKGIETLKEEGADVIIACCHWGQELEHYPDNYQTVLGRKCIDWGADLVVGAHAHVLQGIDYYQGKYIIYGLGNFCFGGHINPKDKNTMIVQAKITLNDEGIIEGPTLTVIPCTISSVSEINDYRPTIAEGEKREEIIQQLNTYSQDYPVSITQEGQVVPKEEE